MSGQQRLKGLTCAYMSGQVDSDLNDRPLLGAEKYGWANVVTRIAFPLTLANSLLPWIIAAAAVLAGWLFAQRRLARWRHRDGRPRE